MIVSRTAYSNGVLNELRKHRMRIESVTIWYNHMGTMGENCCTSLRSGSNNKLCFASRARSSYFLILTACIYKGRKRLLKIQNLRALRAQHYHNPCSLVRQHVWCRLARSRLASALLLEWHTVLFKHELNFTFLYFSKDIEDPIPLFLSEFGNDWHQK